MVVALVALVLVAAAAVVVVAVILIEAVVVWCFVEAIRNKITPFLETLTENLAIRAFFVLFVRGHPPPFCSFEK